MVNTIDRDERRALLAAAVWRLVRRDGLPAASVRAVATEAGLSAGSVRHFFPTQHALHVFAMESLADQIAARIAAHATVQPLPARVEAMVGELLPLTDQSEAELRAWLEFVAASAADERLARVARSTFERTREFLGTIVGDQVSLGLVPADTDIAFAAAELAALIDGLTLQLVHSPHQLDRATAGSIVAHRLRHPARKGRQP